MLQKKCNRPTAASHRPVTIEEAFINTYSAFTEHKQNPRASFGL